MAMTTHSTDHEPRPNDPAGPDPLLTQWFADGAYGGLLPPDVAVMMELGRGYDTDDYGALGRIAAYGDLMIDALGHVGHAELSMVVAEAYEIMDRLRARLIELELERPEHSAWGAVEPPLMRFRAGPGRGRKPQRPTDPYPGDIRAAIDWVADATRIQADPWAVADWAIVTLVTQLGRQVVLRAPGDRHHRNDPLVHAWAAVDDAFARSESGPDEEIQEHLSGSRAWLGSCSSWSTTPGRTHASRDSDEDSDRQRNTGRILECDRIPVLLEHK